MAATCPDKDLLAKIGNRNRRPDNEGPLLRRQKSLFGKGRAQVFSDQGLRQYTLPMSFFRIVKGSEKCGSRGFTYLPPCKVGVLWTNVVLAGLLVR